MSDLTIHNINVSYDESDERVRNFVKYLTREDKKDEMKGYYNQALQNPDGKLNLSDQENNDFTLVCSAGFNCTLGLRGM